MKKIFAAVLMITLVFGFSGCTDKTGTKALLKRNGYTHITTDGYDFFGCSKDDVFQTKFYAKNRDGHSVSGVVCKGWFKGSTLREY